MFPRAELSVEARFITLTNSEPLGRVAIFELTNKSQAPVRRWGCYVNGNYVQLDPQQLSPRETEIVTVRVQRNFTPPLPVEFQLTRSDSAIEEIREGLDSALRAIGIKLAGLNPDSASQKAVAKSEIPAH